MRDSEVKEKKQCSSPEPILQMLESSQLMWCGFGDLFSPLIIPEACL